MTVTVDVCEKSRGDAAGVGVIISTKRWREGSGRRETRRCGALAGTTHSAVDFFFSFLF